MKRIIYIFALVLALTGGAMAQKSFDAQESKEISVDGFAPAQNIFILGGVETTKGTYDAIDEKFWSNTFSLNGKDDSTATHFTISIDHLQPKPGQNTEIVGGNWTFAVFKSGTYAGTLFGDIIGGFISWETDKTGNPVSRYTAVKVRVLGRTNDFGVEEGTVGSFTFYSEVGVKMPQAKGTLNLMY